MPEGSSIHRHARIVNRLFHYSPVTVTSPQGRFSQGATAISRKYPGRARAWGKHLFWPFLESPDMPDNECNTWLHIHLGLYGRWAFAGPGLTQLGGAGIRVARHDSDNLVGTIDGGKDATTKIVDPDGLTGSPTPIDNLVATPTTRMRIESDTVIAQLSGPTRCEVATFSDITATINRLGPDPIRNDASDCERFISLARSKRSPIGQVVMDQSVVAGPGNIYRADCLWRVGINPLRKASNVSKKRLGTLWDDLVTCMRNDIDTGIIVTIPDEYRPETPIETDPELMRFAVYHRTGKPCVRCGTPISEKLMLARRLFWCSGCQR